MNPRVKAALISGLKNAVIVFLAGLVSVYGNSEWYLLLAPVLKIVEKYIFFKE